MARLLDLFSGAGGAGHGYALAGFSVTGVDIDRRIRYFPGAEAFVVADALEYVREHGAEYDAIHASPPCQGYSAHVSSSDSRWVPTRGRLEPRLIEPLREILLELGKPYVIENVVSARPYLEDPFLLCGAMLDREIPRHRLFETNVDLGPLPAHPDCRGLAKRSAAARGWELRDMSVTGKGRGKGWTERASVLLGIDWKVRQHDLSEAIPPAYTKWIGERLLEPRQKLRASAQMALEL